ncbi:MAG: biotin/lipoyl-containing protein, partial [Pseudomonadota bacterium]
VALAIELRRSYRLDHLTGRMRPHHGCTRTAWTVRLGTQTFEARVLRGDGAYPAELILQIGDAEPMRVQSAWQASEPVWTGLIDGAPVAMQHRGGLLRHRGRAAVMKVLRPRVAELLDLMPVREAPDTSRLLLCPMPGTLVSIAVAEGQVVKAGERLAMVEAMKMENVLVAERDATVATIKARPGDVLAVDAVIMEFAGEDEGGSDG